MANDARSSRRSKDDERNSSGKNHVDGKGSSTSCSTTMDTFGLRKSTRETPSLKQNCSCTSTSRKSERCEKKTPTATSVKRKSEIVEKHRMLNPLRMSDKGKKNSSFSYSGSEKSEKRTGSSDVGRKKLKRGKSVKQLTLDACEISRREKKLEAESVHVKKKRMDARTYKSLIKQKRRSYSASDFIEEPERPEKLSLVDNSYYRGGVSKLVDSGEDGGEECSESIGEELREAGIERACGGKERSHSRLRNFDTEAVGNHGEVEMSCRRQYHSSEEEPLEPSEGDSFYASKNGQRVQEILDDAERVHVDCSAVEKLQSAELVGCACMGRLLDGDTGKGTRDGVEYKRKRYKVEMDCKTSATSANIEICTSNAPPPQPSECKIDKIIGTWAASSKRLRGQRGRKKPKVEIDEVGKKCNEVVNNSADPASPRPRLKEAPRLEGGDNGDPANNGSLLLPSSTDSVKHTLYTNHASASTFPSNDSSSLPELDMVESEEGIKLHNVQKNLHVLLRPEISKLSEILQLSEDVKVMARRFLEYIIGHHHVNSEPATLLQAFQISLCWLASSLLKYKVDKKASLALAKQHLSFGCTEEEVNNVYSKLRRLKKMFLRHVGSFKKSVSSKDSISKAEDITKDMPDARMFESIAFIKQNVEVEIEERSENLEFNADRPISQQEQAPKSTIEVKRLSKSIKKIKKKCDDRMIKLILKQQEEIQEFHKTWEEESAQLEKEYRSGLVCYINSNSSVTLDMLRRVDDKFRKKMEERKLQKGIRCKELEAKHFAETNEERKKAICWLEEVKSLGKAELSCELPSCGSESGDTGDDRVHEGHENVASVSGVLVEEQNPNSKQACNVAPSYVTRTAASEAVRYGIPIDTPSVELHPNREINAVVSMTSHSGSMTAFEELSNLHRSADGPENNVFATHSPEQIPDGPTSSAQDVPECLPNVLVGGADFVTVNPDAESRREHTQTDELYVSALDPVVIRNDVAGGSANGGSLSVELYLAKSPLVQPVSPSQVGASPQNWALHGECSRLATSFGMQDGDAHASGNQNVLQQVEVLPLHSTETGPIDQTNIEELQIERAEQLQLSLSTDLPVDHDEPNSHGTSAVERLPSEGRTASQAVGASQFEHPAGPSNQSVMQTGPSQQFELLIEHAEQLLLSPSTDCPVDHNLPDSHATSRVEQQPSEGHTASQTVGASQIFEHPAGPSNQAVMQTGATLAPCPPIHATDISLGQNQLDLQLAIENDHQLISKGCTSCPSAETPTQLVENAAGIPNQFILGTQLGMHPPLDTSHGRFGTHLQLHSAHQMATWMPTQSLFTDPLHNELERLRRETEQAIGVHEDMKLQLKSDCDKEIEEIIAEIRGKYEVKLKDAETAFLLKKKELDKNHSEVLKNKLLAEAFHSMCVGALTMQQVVPSNFMQQLHLPSSQHALRPASVTGSASVQFVHHSPALFSSVPSSRPPLIVPIAPPPRNLQVVREIRAPAPHLQSFRPSSHTSPAPHLQSFRPSSPMSPAPHLQSFRPSSPMSLTSIPFLPRGFPFQQAQRNLPTASPSVPLVPPPPPPAQHQPAVTGGIREMLFDVENQPGAHPPNVLPPIPNLGSNFGSLGVSQFGAPGSGGGGGIIDSIIGSGVATDIVCLSDDE